MEHHSAIYRPGPGARPKSVKTAAIVLRAFDRGEADRVVTLLTPSLGKLRAQVRGARRLNSRLGGHVDVLNHARLDVALGHRGDVVTGAESLESFGAIKANLGRVAFAFYLAELAATLLPDESPHPLAFQLLLDALRALNAGAGARTVARFTELRLLEDSGFMPELFVCIGCGREIEQGKHRFAPRMGGVVCDACRVEMGRDMPLSVDALKVLRHFARSDLAAALGVSVDGALARELEVLLEAVLREVTERELATEAFIDHLSTLRARAERTGAGG